MFSFGLEIVCRCARQFYICSTLKYMRVFDLPSHCRVVIDCRTIGIGDMNCIRTPRVLHGGANQSAAGNHINMYRLFTAEL